MKIYIDLDGVLADFDKQWEDLTDQYGIKAPAKPPFFQTVLKANPQFWYDMPKMAQCDNLVQWASRWGFNILSKPVPSDPNCVPGKIHWVKTNLRHQPAQILLKLDKSPWAVDADGPNILIDDRTSNTVPWAAKGGHAMLYSPERHEEIIRACTKLLGE